MQVPTPIEFLTADRLLIEQYPPVPATKAMPQWFKDMPLIADGASLMRGGTTAKACPGIVDYMTMGYILPLWTDYLVQVDPNGNMHVNSAIPNSADFFDEGTTREAVPGTIGYGGAIKFMSPWFIKTPPDWSIMVLPIWGEPLEGFTIMPGCVQTDTLHFLNIILNPTFFDDSRLLKAGTPIVQIVPIPRWGSRAKLDLIDKDEAAYLHAAGRGGIVGGGGERLIAHAFRKSAAKGPRRRWASQGG